ncbi:MAG: nicotinate-nucleotide diphosphorylase (carboxylating), partial [Gammaproteobacteria bacterium]|nr:nicotinate-nucleotide diphosphorylase (carboxylating) [Gammaproteobacteria bacterium]
MQTDADLFAEIRDNVARALREDLGGGDLTAQLIPASTI